MTVGQRIKTRREQLGLTQEELAKKVGYKSRSSINKIELSRDLPLRKVEKVAVALDTSPSFLMGWVQDPDPNYDPRKLDDIPIEEIKQKDDIINHSSDEEVKAALDFYRSVQSCPQDVRSAIDTLIKSVPHDL